MTMTKPEPRDRRRLPDHERRATQRDLRDPDEPEEAALAREIERLRRESEEALAAYKRAFEAAGPGRTTPPRRFP
jgi:hypothetical protein